MTDPRITLAYNAEAWRDALKFTIMSALSTRLEQNTY